MKSLGFLILLLCVPSFGILPLPYSIEAIEEDAPKVEVARDPKNIEAYNELFHQSKKRELELPHFEAQPNALGYTANTTFAVPPELKERVHFWKKIYSEFSTAQAVIHDSDYPEIIYGVIDVGRYTSEHSVLSYRKRMKMMNRMLRDEKEKYLHQLLKLHHSQSDLASIPSDLLPLFRKFESVREKNKFLAASGRIRAQLGQRDKVVQGFLFGGRYFNKMMEIFAERGMPQELTRLPLVESAFNLNARSKVGASGIWQFMRSTGKMYLRIDRYVDERNDPIAATYGATALLRENYEALGSWPLAISAWNHGREGIARAMRQLSTNSLPHIIKHYQSRSFGFASSNFYSEFLAMLEVEKEYREHFGKLVVDSPLEFGEMTVVDEIRFHDIAKDCQMDSRELRVYNPGLTDYAVSQRTYLPRGLRLRFPTEKKAECLSSRKLLAKNGFNTAHHIKPFPKAKLVAKITRNPKSVKPKRVAKVQKRARSRGLVRIARSR